MPPRKKLAVKVMAKKPTKKKPEPEPIESDVEDDVESTRSWSPTRSPQRSQADAPKKRMKKKPLVLSEVKELEMAEWMRRHAFLYSKGMKEYKDSRKKNRLWQEKAEDLGVESGALLKVWYESVRTKVGKISDKKSGLAHKDLTERDTFLMSNFGFLATHISRMKETTAFSVSTNCYCSALLISCSTV